MWRSTDFTLDDASSLELYDGRQTVGYPLTVVDPGDGGPGKYYRDGVPFYHNGHHMAASQFGSIYATCTEAQIDTLMEQLREAGCNSISVMQFDGFGGGLVPTGGDKGHPVCLWDNGYPFRSNINWTHDDSIPTGGAGTGPDILYTRDTSDAAKIVWRKYEVIASGNGGSNPPTGTGASITPSGSAATYKYLGPACQAYNEEFFTGNPLVGSAGFDYFLDACARSGIYVGIRFDNWNTVFANTNSGYVSNTSPSGDGAQCERQRMCWFLDGTSGTPDIVTGIKAHLTNLLDRVNSVNGRRYGDDPTIYSMDLLNEQGVSFAFFNTSNATTPSTSTWDWFVKIGSTNNVASEPNAAIVAWWDAAWLAWFIAKRGSAPSVYYTSYEVGSGGPGARFDTLPTCAFNATAGGGPNVAARNIFRSTSNSDGTWNQDVAEFLRTMEVEGTDEFDAHIRSKSSHILVGRGQFGWVFEATRAAGDIADNHNYLGSDDTDSNSYTNTITNGGGTDTLNPLNAGVTWASAANGTLKMVFNTLPGNDPALGDRTILVGQTLRCTVGSWVGFPVVSSIDTPNKIVYATNLNATTSPSVAGLVDDTKRSATVNCPALDHNNWPYHVEPPAENVPTVCPYYDRTGTEVYYERSGGPNSGWEGDSGLGVYGVYVANATISGLPVTVTERGMRGIAGPVQGLHHVAYPLLGLLQGDSGGHYFNWNTSNVTPLTGEHQISGNGEAFLSTEIIALMSRWIDELPQLDVAEVRVTDMDLKYADIGSGGYGFINAGYWAFSLQNWRGPQVRRIALKVGATYSPSTVNYNSPSYSTGGQVHAVLNDEMAGLWYVWLGMGCAVYSNSKIIVIHGRIPTTSTGATGFKIAGVPGALLSRLSFNTSDGKAWYGRIVWASLDGSDLGEGKSVLYSFQTPRDEGNIVDRMVVDTLPRVEILPDGIGPDNNPGVILKNDLSIELEVSQPMVAYAIRAGSRVDYSPTQGGGTLTIEPEDPRIILNFLGDPVKLRSRRRWLRM